MLDQSSNPDSLQCLAKSFKDFSIGISCNETLANVCSQRKRMSKFMADMSRLLKTQVRSSRHPLKIQDYCLNKVFFYLLFNVMVIISGIIFASIYWRAYHLPGAVLMTSTCVISFNSQHNSHHPHSHFVDEENKD